MADFLSADPRRSQAWGTGQPATESGALLTGVHVLVVEDHPASARLLHVLLSKAGADVQLAHSAEEAIALLQVFPAHVAIVDLILPRMSGLLLAQHLTSQFRTQGIVVIAVSVINGSDTERLALEHGCSAYVHKPLDIQTFVATVIAQLKGRGTQPPA